MVETRTKSAWRMIGEKWHEIEATEGVFLDILSRLPAKCLLSCKAVSKYWFKAISDKDLVNMHASRSKGTPLYIVCPRLDEAMVLYLMNPWEWTCHYRVSIPMLGNYSSLYMLSSFSGLICCISRAVEEEKDVVVHDIEICVCNPATREITVLPQGSPSFSIEPRVGVAYGPDVSEYQVFRIFCAEECGGQKKYDEVQEDEEFDGSVRTDCYECEVYSSSSGSWTNIGPVPEIPMCIAYAPYASGHVFVGGRIYWLVASRGDHATPGSILSVDMEGHFKVIDLPEYGENLREEDRITPATFLINLQGSLAMLVLHVDSMDIWLLKEEGGEPIWDLEREDRVLFSEIELVQFATAWNNELLFATEYYWCTYELDSREWKIRERSRERLNSPVAFVYSESLLRCNGALNH